MSVAGVTAAAGWAKGLQTAITIIARAELLQGPLVVVSQVVHFGSLLKDDDTHKQLLSQAKAAEAGLDETAAKDTHTWFFSI